MKEGSISDRLMKNLALRRFGAPQSCYPQVLSKWGES
jgi:hypothetical protein